MTDVAKLVRPSLRCARAVFFTNMTQRGAHAAIPLGIFCEVKTSQGHGLALRARKVLSDAEIKAVAPIFQGALSNPFQYLSTEFEAAWSASIDSGGALGFLSKKHSAALSVLAAYHPAAADRPWWQGLFGEPKVTDLLESVTRAEFQNMITQIPSWDGPAPSNEPPAPSLLLKLAA
jgi:hypothetical protein